MNTGIDGVEHVIGVYPYFMPLVGHEIRVGLRASPVCGWKPQLGVRREAYNLVLHHNFVNFVIRRRGKTEIIVHITRFRYISPPDINLLGHRMKFSLCLGECE